MLLLKKAEQVPLLHYNSVGWAPYISSCVFQVGMSVEVGSPVPSDNGVKGLGIIETQHFSTQCCIHYLISNIGVKIEINLSHYQL